MDANKRFDRERAARIKPSPRTLQQRWDLGTLTTIVLARFIGPKKWSPLRLLERQGARTSRTR
jgi:hypothetical protein